MRDPHSVLLHPLRSEKGVVSEPLGKYQFRVMPDANKVEIRHAIEVIYGVKVASVNTLSTRGKMKRVGRYSGLTAMIKKAVVTLEKGQRIDSLSSS